MRADPKQANNMFIFLAVIFWRETWCEDCSFHLTLTPKPYIKLKLTELAI